MLSRMRSLLHVVALLLAACGDGTGGTAPDTNDSGSTTSDAGTSLCPATEPVTGMSCGPASHGCTYGATCCICDFEGVGSCGAAQYTCSQFPQNDAQCPAQAPSADTACAGEGLLCRYCTDDALPFRACQNGRWVAAPLACAGPG